MTTTWDKLNSLRQEHGKRSIEYRRELAHVFKPVGQYQCIELGDPYPTIELREFSMDGYETTVQCRALVWSAE